MVWCSHCGEDKTPVKDPDGGFICCSGCGRVIDQDIFADEPTFTKDSSGNSRLSGKMMSSMDYGTEVRERIAARVEEMIGIMLDKLAETMEGKDAVPKGKDRIVNGAVSLYRIALDKSFTRGRQTSHVAAACTYIQCRALNKAYLLIDFSDYLKISVYVLGAVFLQLCQTLCIAEHHTFKRIVDPSLFIHRFTGSLLGETVGNMFDKVTGTALHILASMKRDWMLTGRKPSGLCGAAIYISVLFYGLEYSKSDVVSVVRICEGTLTKRLNEFENTESGGLTFDEFLKRADELNRASLQSQLPRPGEILCQHKDRPHFVHGLCKNCFDELNEICGGLEVEGGAEPPAFQRAERLRLERAKEQEKMRELCVDEIETELSKNDPGTIRCEVASTKHETMRHQAVDNSARDVCEPIELVTSACNESESLSDIDDVEVDGYLHDEAEMEKKKIIWEVMNRDYLEEQAAKEAYNLKTCERDANGEAIKKSKKRRKKSSAEEAKKSGHANTPLEATRQMLMRKTFSSRVNYEALDSLYTTDQEGKQQGGKLETDHANDEQGTIQGYDDTYDGGAVDDEDGYLDKGGFSHAEDDFGYGDSNNADDDISFF